MFVAHVRKSMHTIEEFRNLQKQQVLKDTPKLMRVRKMKARKRRVTPMRMAS